MGSSPSGDWGIVATFVLIINATFVLIIKNNNCQRAIVQYPALGLAAGEDVPARWSNSHRPAPRG